MGPRTYFTLFLGHPVYLNIKSKQQAMTCNSHENVVKSQNLKAANYLYFSIKKMRFIFKLKMTTFLVCPEMFDLLTTKRQLIKAWWEMTWGFWYFLINQIQAVKRKRCTKIIKIINRVKTLDFNLARPDLWDLIGCFLF